MTYKRQPSGNSSRRVTQPKDNSKEKGSKVMATSSRQNIAVQPQTHSCLETTAISASSIKKRAELMESYDSARISQWAAHSANGPSSLLENETQEQCTISCSHDMMTPGMAPLVSSQFSVSQPGDLQAFPCAALDLPYTSAFPYHQSITSDTGDDPIKFRGDHNVMPGPDYGYPLAFDSTYGAGPSSIDDQMFSNFAPGDALPFSPVEADPSLSLGNDNAGLPLSSSWSTSGTSMTQPIDWSPTSGLTPSSSSMQSSHGSLGHQPDTPVSVNMFDGSFATGQNGHLEAENSIIPPFSLGDTTMIQASIDYTDPERFASDAHSTTFSQSNPMLSTIRPTRNFRRPAIPMDIWTGHDGPPPPFGLPITYNGISGSRRSSEGEVKNARDHHFYRATPKEDGLYHCPFTASEKCTHKPDKLKCNYDKHMDSHLKPYRCKSYGCAQIQFSSTACLLRHEREAHGMHGHGPKPHLCFFKDCDRAQEDNGFPRRWNLYDHMKRVHDFAGTEASNKSNSPSPSTPNSEAPTDLPKKKRTPSPVAEGPPKRPKVSAAGRSMEQNSNAHNTVQPAPLPMMPECSPDSLNQIWYDHIVQVQARLQRLDPTDPTQWRQYQADTETLQTIGLNLQFWQQAQVAH